MDIIVSVVENVPIIEFLCWIDFFKFQYIFTVSMKQCDLKNVNGYLNTNIYSYLETDLVIKVLIHKCSSFLHHMC